jgi:hypothetical protein
MVVEDRAATALLAALAGKSIVGCDFSVASIHLRQDPCDLSLDIFDPIESPRNGLKMARLLQRSMGGSLQGQTPKRIGKKIGDQDQPQTSAPPRKVLKYCALDEKVYIYP